MHLIKRATASHKLDFLYLVSSRDVKYNFSQVAGFRAGHVAGRFLAVGSKLGLAVPEEISENEAQQHPWRCCLWWGDQDSSSWIWGFRSGTTFLLLSQQFLLEVSRELSYCQFDCLQYKPNKARSSGIFGIFLESVSCAFMCAVGWREAGRRGA